MRVVCLSALLLAAGCTVNVPELTVAQATLEGRLAQRKEIADTLNDLRQGVDGEEQRLREELEALSAQQRAAVDAVQADYQPRPLPEATVEVPRKSLLEGQQAAALRQRVAETELRIAELDKLVSEVNRITGRRYLVAARLAVVDQLKGGMSARPR